MLYILFVYVEKDPFIAHSDESGAVYPSESPQPHNQIGLIPQINEKVRPRKKRIKKGQKAHLVKKPEERTQEQKKERK